MKNLFVFGLAIFAGLFLMACIGGDNGGQNSSRIILDDPKEVIAGDFSIKMALDKTEASVGDIVTATVIFKNLSDKDIVAEIPDWVTGMIRKPIEDYTAEDILFVCFVTWDDFEWNFIDIGILERPTILIECGAVIERQFEYTITSLGNLEIHAGAFFISPADTANIYGEQIFSKPIKITVR